MKKNQTIKITGMTCAACSARIEKGLKKIEGVDSAEVNLALESATVVYDADKAGPENFLFTVKNLGYGVIEDADDDIDKEKKERDRELGKIRNAVIGSSLLSLPLVAGMILMLAAPEYNIFHNFYLQLILAAPVQFLVGSRFYKNSWHSIKSKSPGMDLLVATGTSAAFFFSLYNGWIKPALYGGHGDVYFEASAVVITLVMLGKYLEALAKGKTSESIKKLIALQPDSATVVRNGEEIIVRTRDLHVGDIISVKPGEKIPADGIIVTGSSAIDESMITGESMPKDKSPGDTVTGGTINRFGTITFSATRTGRDTFLAMIIKTVEHAQATKPPIQKLADKISSIFVPAMLIISAVTFAAWFLYTGDIEPAIVSAVAVLVIACPCALGLATPTAVMVGTGIGAEHGILIKNGESLEKIHKVDAIILDKTGTLTTGDPHVSGIITVGTDELELIRIAAIAEKKSEHPLASPVTKKAKELQLEIPDPDIFSAYPGKGVAAEYGTEKILAGSKKFLMEHGVSDSALEEMEASPLINGKTAIYISRNGVLSGVLTLSDTIRPGAKEAVNKLKAMGIDIYMATGDNIGAARATGLEAGIENIFAGMLPEEKLALVEKLQKHGKTVAMTGDGINDAPALAKADIGIAIGSGTDIAIESSDITIASGSIESIVSAIHLSRKTIGKIKQNLFWAFIYNVIGIPFAAMGFLNPVIAGTAMAFSSVSVVTNSLLLKKFRFMGSSKK